ncbi:MAG: diguanylate cyclase domain-containing protein [Thermoleophilia bacterium]
MSLLRRVIVANAVTLLVVVGVLILGVGVIEGQRRADIAARESRGTAQIVAAALQSGGLMDDAALTSAFLRDVARRMSSDGGTDRSTLRDIVVVDSAGTVLAATSDYARGSTFAGADGPIADAVHAGESVMFRVVTVDGTRTYCAVPTELDGTVLVIVVEHFAEAAPTPFWRLLGGFGVLALATGALLLALQAGLMSRWLITPLTKLKIAMDSLGWGEFSTRVSTGQAPEVDAVTNSFNAMAVRLDDMSDRRRELELLAESLAPGILLTDEAGAIKWASRRAADLLRVSIREIRGSSWTGIVSDPSLLERTDAKGLELPPGWTDERVLEAVGEERVWLALAGFPLRRDDGKLLGNAVVVTDVTETRTWRSEQRRLMGALGEANRLRDGLFRLLRGDLGARLATLADRDWEARDMIALLGELGDLEASYLRAVVEECSANELIEAAIESRGVLAASRGVNVQVRPRDIEVLADRAGLVHCLSHVLSAAFYTATGSVRVGVVLDVARASGRRARLDVEILSPDLGDLDLEDLVSGSVDATVLGSGPGMFGLALYLAARHAAVMRTALELRRGDEGSLVMSLFIPLSPLAPEARRDPSDGPVPLESAVVDSLTGLVSRPVFERILSEQVFRAARLGRSLSLLALDIDGLSLLNRRYGAGTGDRLLREVADTVRRALRKDDVAGRVRGAVMMVMLPDTDRRVAAAVAEKVGWTINRHIAATPDNLPAGRVSASIGLAGYPQNGAAARDLMRQAEIALRAAKEEGGNRVKEAESQAS